MQHSAHRFPSPARPCGEIGECRSFQNRDGRIADVPPNHLHCTTLGHGAGFRLASGRAWDRRQRPLEQSDDSFEGDLFGTVVQPVAARRATDRPNKPTVSQLHQYLSEEGLGYICSLGQFIGCHCLPMGNRESQHCSGRVVRLTGDPHSSSVFRAWWACHRVATSPRVRRILRSTLVKKTASTSTPMISTMIM